jgi:hypothetical protein
LIGLDSDHALGARHLHCGIGSVDIVVPDVEAGHLEWQHHPALVAPPVPQDTSRSMRPMGVDVYPGMTP